MEPPAREVLSGEVLAAPPVRGADIEPARTVLQPATAQVSSILRELRQRPMQAAELLALAAVARYGPGAAADVAWLRGSYPNAAAEGIARVAANRFVRQARNRGAVAGLAGPLAVLVDAGTLHVLHAELILHIAAAFGHDPAAPERAAELLYLQGVHHTAAEASAAVRATTDAVQAVTQPTHASTQPANGNPARLGRPLVRSLALSALRVGARRAMRLVPGAGAVIGAIANARATDELAARALRFYRHRKA